MKTIDVKIGDKIKALRKKRGLSQIGLAEKIGLSFQQIQKYEKGLTQITVKRLQQIAEVLNVSIQSFFDEDDLALRLSSPEITYNGNTPPQTVSIRTNREGLELLKYVDAISNKKVKDSLLAFLKELSKME